MNCVDIPTQSELVRNNHLDTITVRDYFEIESLMYLSLENINDVLPLNNFLKKCIGNYNET